MRICLYTETALPRLGGQQLVVDALAREFVKMGHEVVVLTQNPRKMKARDEELGYRVVRHPRFISTRRFVWWYRRYLLKLQRRERFDVIHCHSVYPTGWIGGRCKEELGAKVVITSHGGDVTEGNPRVKKAGVLERHVEALRLADRLVSIGKFTTQGYERLLPGVKGVVEIPNGVDARGLGERVERPGGVIGEPGKFFFFIGRLAKRKGVDVLLRAVALAEGVSVVIAGEGDERGELERLAEELGVSDRVKFVGRAVGEEKKWYLQNARCVVVPSRGWEAFPLVVLEAYAAGRPVVASRIAGLEDLVRPGETGWLVKEESVEELAGALRESEKGEVEEMGLKALRVAERLDWGMVAKRYIEEFEKLISIRG